MFDIGLKSCQNVSTIPALEGTGVSERHHFPAETALEG